MGTLVRKTLHKLSLVAMAAVFTTMTATSQIGRADGNRDPDSEDDGGDEPITDICMTIKNSNLPLIPAAFKIQL
jgi:hypothetical protein